MWPINGYQYCASLPPHFDANYNHLMMENQFRIQQNQFLAPRPPFYLNEAQNSPFATIASERAAQRQNNEAEFPTRPNSSNSRMDNTKLWEFLLELLVQGEHPNLIQWTNNEGEFKLLDAEAVARLWGQRKVKPNMNYDKLSRALRYYYDKNIMKKVNGQKFVYRFVNYPEGCNSDRTPSAPCEPLPSMQQFKLEPESKPQVNEERPMSTTPMSSSVSCTNSTQVTPQNAQMNPTSSHSPVGSTCSPASCGSSSGVSSGELSSNVAPSPSPPRHSTPPTNNTMHTPSPFRQDTTYLMTQSSTNLTPPTSTETQSRKRKSPAPLNRTDSVCSNGASAARKPRPDPLNLSALQTPPLPTTSSHSQFNFLQHMSSSPYMSPFIPMYYQAALSASLFAPNSPLAQLISNSPYLLSSPPFQSATNKTPQVFQFPPTSASAQGLSTVTSAMTSLLSPATVFGGINSFNHFAAHRFGDELKTPTAPLKTPVPAIKFD